MSAPLPGTVLYAMAQMEGFFQPNSRPARNNNPLDLSFCPEAVEFGATSGDPRFAVFPDAETGWDAGRRWLSVPAKFSGGTLVAGYMGATLLQVVNRFAPPSENDSANYAAFVAESTDSTLQTVLTPELLG
jgi:hypothetical protein